MVSTFLAFVLAAASSSRAVDQEPVELAWVGHQIVRGTRNILVLGTVQTEAQNFTLAKVTRRANSIDIEQHACRIVFKKVMGVQVSIASDTLDELPPAHIRFIRDDSGKWHAPPWMVGWATEDVDHDSHPGVTVTVDASICSGDIYVASASMSEANATLTKNGMRGSITVRVQQAVLGASGTCLRIASKDTDEIQTGSFAYRAVPANTTCASLANGPWPVRADLGTP